MNFVDLYCGAGLGGRGAARAGGVPVVAVDNWGQATATYLANFPDCKVLTGNVEDINISKLKLDNQQVDILLTSPECTAHSIARGAKKGCEKSRETAINILPWVESLAPRWIIVENVVEMRAWSRHSELKTTIESRGYTVSELLLNAASFGVPQARKRLFMVCDREGQPPTLADFEKLYVKNQVPVREIIEWDKGWKVSPLYQKGRAHNTLMRAERAIKELGEGVPFIIVYYGSDYAGGWQTLDVPLRTITTIDRFALVTYEKSQFMMRMLQPSELLKAMGAADHMLPVGSRRDKVKLCGNGVCSTVMEIIFREIDRISNGQRNILGSGL